MSKHILFVVTSHGEIDGEPTTGIWLPEFSEPYASVIEAGYPIDVSVYGIRGLGGNMRDWCANAYEADAPASLIVSTFEANPRLQNPAGHRVVRGGSWNGTATNARAATRLRLTPSLRGAVSGFRLLRALSGER